MTDEDDVEPQGIDVDTLLRMDFEDAVAMRRSGPMIEEQTQKNRRMPPASTGHIACASAVHRMAREDSRLKPDGGVCDRFDSDGMLTTLMCRPLYICALLAAAGCDGGGADAVSPDGSPPDAGISDVAPVDTESPDAARPDAEPSDTESCVPGPREAPDLDTVERIVSIADGTGDSPGYATSGLALLAANNDALFPAFAGRDLAATRSEIALVRLHSAGASYLAFGEAPDVVCGTEMGCLDFDDARQTVVVVTLGINDLITAFVTRRASPESMAEDFGAHVRRALALVDDPGHFGRRPALVVVNLPDPTDGTGELEALGLLPPDMPVAALPPPEIARETIAAFNAALAAEVERCGGVLVDAHGHFLGHGLLYDEPALPDHDTEDPTRWLLTATELDPRGAHELRALLWAALGGELPDAVPPDVPPPSPLGELPEATVWATAVVDANVTTTVVVEGTEAPNVAVDATRALGPPEATAEGAVAIGVLGASITVELGADAIDGPGPDLVVYELGTLSGGAPEPYRVYVAEAADGPFVRLGDSLGERAFDLAGVELAFVRYVKVESQRIEADLARSPGSVFFPGPEIDAVGAVNTREPNAHRSRRSRFRDRRRRIERRRHRRRTRRRRPIGRCGGRPDPARGAERRWRARRRDRVGTRGSSRQ